MSLKDLDLNLEFEEEIEKKEALEVGELDFHTGDDGGAGSGNVTDIKQARSAASSKTTSQAKPTSQAMPVVNSQEMAQLQAQIQLLEKQVKDLTQAIGTVKESAAAKVAVANFKSDFLVEHLTAAGLMENQVNQVINQIYKKVPALKNEALMIKKLVNDFHLNLKKKK